MLSTSHGVIGFNDAQDLQHHLARFHLRHCSNPLASTHPIVTRSISYFPSAVTLLVPSFFDSSRLRTLQHRSPAQVNCNIHHAETSLHTRDQLPLLATASVYKLFKALLYCPSLKPTRCDPKRPSATLSSSHLGLVSLNLKMLECHCHGGYSLDCKLFCKICANI